MYFLVLCMFYLFLLLKINKINYRFTKPKIDFKEQKQVKHARN